MNCSQIPLRSGSQHPSNLSSSSLAIYLAVPLLLLPTISRPQTGALSGVSISVERISVEHGLSYRSVNAITQDRQGFIWIGTQDGLNRFDGQNFIIYRNSPDDTTSLSSSYIWSLYEDRKGVFWVGTQNGLNRFDPIRNNWTRLFHNPIDSTTLSNNEIRSMYEDRAGVFWVGTAHGLNRFDEKSQTWTRLFPVPDDATLSGNNFINVVLEDSKGCFWIGTGNFNIAGGGLCMLDRSEGRFTHFHHDPGNPSSLPNDWVSAMLEDSSGILWIGTEGGVCTFNRSSNTFNLHPIPFAGPQSANRLYIKSICQDCTGAIWVSTFGWGVLRYEMVSNSFLRYTYDSRDPLSMSSPYVTTLFVDRSGLLWAGTWGGGMNIVVIKPFVHYQALANLHFMNSGTTALIESKRGALYIGTGAVGAWKYDPIKRTVLHVPMPPAYDPKALPSVVSDSDARLINSLREDNSGSVWVSSWNSGELLRYDPIANISSVLFRTRDRTSGGRELITTFLLDVDSAFWVCTDEKLYSVDKRGKTSTVYTHNARHTQTINPGDLSSIVRDRSGVLWVGTSTGLLRYHMKTKSISRFGRDEGNPSSLSDNSVWSLFEDHVGRIWIGTANGLNRFDSSTSSFFRFTTQEGLAGRTMISIQEDGKGRLWVATEKGISRVDPETHAVLNFDQSDGLPSVEYSEGCAIRRMNGELLIGTNTGLLAFDPEKVKFLEYVPPVVITGIRKHNESVQFSSSPEKVRKIVLSHSDDVFSVEFAALSFEDRRFNQYAYWLDGFDHDWIYCGMKKEATYTNLDPGTYTFRVRGSNHDRIWNDTGTSLRITVTPAYWQTAWFRTTAIALILGSIGLVFSREVRRLKRDKLIQQAFSKKLMGSQEAERKRLASELHDGLGQNLLVVKNELRQFLSDKYVSKKDLHRVDSLMQESVESVREISSNLHPHHIERLGLCAAVEALVENVAHSSGLNIESACDRFDHEMPKEIEIHAYRIIQEALSNIVRHASARNARVEIRRDPKSIDVTITDDGHGFDINEFRGDHTSERTGDVARGFGVASMSERARIIGGTLEIESSASSGTTIHLILPVA